MARLIDADALKKFLHEEDFETPDERWKPESEFAQMIDYTPTVDAVEVVHGEWERTQFVGKSGFYNLRDVICSECKTVCSFLYDKNTPMNYCPNCGAKMDGKRKVSE